MSETVVIDNGSGTCKAGFAGQSGPRAIVPTVVGRRSLCPREWIEPRHLILGENVKRCPNLQLTYPIERGLVTNWNDMEKIWFHTFYSQLLVPPENHPIFLTDSPSNPKQNREKMAEIMFEAFTTPALSIANQAALCLYASNRTTGVVLDSGHGVTHASPVIDGLTLPHATMRLDLGGSDLTEYLAKSLRQEGWELASPTATDVARHIKENMTYVTIDFKKEMEVASTTLSVEMSYELPNKQVVTISEDRFLCPESLFQPPVIELASRGIQDAIYDSINACEENRWRELYRNIVLSGGNTMFPGIEDRLQKQIASLQPSVHQINIIAPSERKYSAWIGGSILASLSSFQKMWIIKEEYDEFGPCAVHRKCF